MLSIAILTKTKRVDKDLPKKTTSLEGIYRECKLYCVVMCGASCVLRASIRCGRAEDMGSSTQLTKMPSIAKLHCFHNFLCGATVEMCSPLGFQGHRAHKLWIFGVYGLWL